MEPNQDKEKVLEELGLSTNESKVYLALLDIGATTAGKITDASKIHRTSVYDALERLIKKGLVSFIVKDETKFFEATHPKNLMSVLEEKKNLLNQFMPQLELSRKMAESKGDACIFQGLKAAKDMMDHMLDLNDTILVYGVAKEAPMLAGAFLQDFHKRRIAKKVQFDHIYNTDAEERAKWLNTLPHTRAKVLPKEFDSPVATNICGDELILIMWQRDAIVIQIKNKQIADAYRNYFNLLWELAKTPETKKE